MVCRYKTEGVVAETPERIMDFIRPGARRLDWDSMITSLEILQTPEQVNMRLHHVNVQLGYESR